MEGLSRQVFAFNIEYCILVTIWLRERVLHRRLHSLEAYHTLAYMGYKMDTEAGIS